MPEMMSQRRDRAALQHLQQHRSVAVDVDDVGLRRIAVAHVGDVAHVDHGAVDGLDRQVAELFDPGAAQLLSWTAYSKSPIFCVPTGVIRFCAASALATSWPDRPRACSACGLRSICIWRGLPPIGIGDRRARNRHQRRAHLVDADVGEVLLGQALAGQRDLDDRNRRSAVVEDQRRCRARRHRSDQGLRNRGDLRVGGADVDIGLEEDLDDAEAVIGIGFDVLDVVDGRRQRALERRGDAARPSDRAAGRCIARPR